MEAKGYRYFMAFNVWFLLVSPALPAKSVPSGRYRSTVERVREYLRDYEKTEETNAQHVRTTNWLANSNKIGLGFNVLSGSPICYTGGCQMSGFTRSVFKLNYVSPSPGSCTDKLIPDYVELDCLPSTSLNTVSETISSVNEFKKSITDKIDISASANYLAAGFSYAFSKETKNMLDNIVKHNRTSIATKVLVSFAKLSLFEPTATLSDNFRYVIENMPCCENDDPDIEEYIEEFIFDYFGFTYITSALLGGVAQQHILIDQQQREELEITGINIKHQAKISFQFKFGLDASTTFTNSQEESHFTSFMSTLHSIESTTLGGDPYFTTMSEWSKTVPNNPVVIQFSLRDIFRLLTKQRFPNDPLISTKLSLIRLTLDKYLSRLPLFCYNDCGGNNGSQGTCISTGSFQMGQCQCKSNWTGVDCMIPNTDKNEILHGTICGFDRKFIKSNCQGLQPSTNGCPDGWSKKTWVHDLTVCFKNRTVVAKPTVGTLCGLFATFDHDTASSDILCNHTHLHIYVTGKKCPESYLRMTGIRSTDRDINSICYSMNAQKDLPGTICGMQVEGSVDGPTCAGYNPGLRQCPPNYTVRRTVFSYHGFCVCSKD